MTVAGEDEVEFVGRQFFDKERVVHEHDVFAARLWGVDFARPIKTGRTGEMDFAVVAADLFVGEPCAAGVVTAFFDEIEIAFAPVIVIAGHAVDGRFDVAHEGEGFGQVNGFFDEVAGEADCVGGKVVDGVDDAFEIWAIAFVMDVGDVDDAMGRLIGETNGFDAEPLGFDEAGVGAEDGG